MIGDDQAIQLGDVEVGSLLDGDDQALAGYNVSHAAQRCLISGVDHVLTLRCVLQAGTITMSGPWTLTRAVIERAATVVWMLKPSERVTRQTHALRYWRDSADNRRKWASDAGAEPALANVEGKLAKLALSIGANPNAVTTQMNWADIVADAGKACGVHPASARARWRECSGFAHGAAWADHDLSETFSAAPIRGGFEVGMRLNHTKFSEATGLAEALLHKAMDLYASSAATD